MPATPIENDILEQIRCFWQISTPGSASKKHNTDDNDDDD